VPSLVDPDAFNAFEAAGWEEKAVAYDGYFGSLTSQAVEPLLDAASVGAGTRVLDVATGPGYVAGRAAERGASVVGVDVAQAMVELAGRLHPGLDFREADAHALPFEDASFDAVVGNFAILHLGRPEQAVSEFVRTIVPGGALALTAWDLPVRMRIIGVLLDCPGRGGSDAARGPARRA
jgi:ubiquinone/menaquinone biosynthesis C-methylase UbiE